MAALFRSPVPSVWPEARPLSIGAGEVGVVMSHGFTGSVQSIGPWARGLATRIRLHTLAACGHRFIDCVRDGGLVDHVFAPPVPLDACTTALAA